jgi:recombination protein RecA
LPEVTWLGEYKANMPAAATLRIEIEKALAKRIPSALTPAPRIVRPVAATGIAELDDVLQGGLPMGAITEIAGPECSGRMALALSCVARMTTEGKVCAWIDVTDSLCPESAAGAGINLARLLWVRCGVAKSRLEPARNNMRLPDKCFMPSPTKKGLHGGGCGPHPRSEIKGLSAAVGQVLSTGCAEPRHSMHARRERDGPFQPPLFKRAKEASAKPLSRMDQALRVTDLLLQTGGFSSIVLDLGSIEAEHVLRVPISTWFRYRAAAERTQASILLLSQHACAKSSAGLVLRAQPGEPLQNEQTVFTGMRHRVEVVRERFAPAPANLVPFRKPPQAERHAGWRTQTAWAGIR